MSFCNLLWQVKGNVREEKVVRTDNQGIMVVRDFECECGMDGWQRDNQQRKQKRRNGQGRHKVV